MSNTDEHLSEFSVRRVGAADFNSARRAIELNNRTSQRPSAVDESALQRFLSRDDSYLMVATIRSQVVGSLHGFALRHPGRTAPQFLLYGIDVRDENRGKGVGTALVRSFVVEARKACANEVWVCTDEMNVPALKMYTRCGFERHGTGEVMMEIAL